MHKHDKSNDIENAEQDESASATKSRAMWWLLGLVQVIVILLMSFALTTGFENSISLKAVETEVAAHEKSNENTTKYLIDTVNEVKGDVKDTKKSVDEIKMILIKGK